MQCDRARDMIGAYIDGELTGPDRQAVAGHLQSCAACAALAQDLVRIGRQVAAAGREPAPKALALRVRAALAEEAASQQELQGNDPAEHVLQLPRRRHGAWGTSMVRQAAAIATACVVSSALTWGALTWTGSGTSLERDIVSAHVRSLLQESPIQIASSDSHSVKPWFNGRIDFAPDVKDLTSEGFPLLGGRLDYIDERRVGAIVYRRRLHTVNVFMWPAASAEPKPPRMETAKGYNILRWSRGGVIYWAISDLNAGELRQLQSLM